jgi:hypothetical protein
MAAPFAEDKTKLFRQMIKQLLKSVPAKYRNLSVARGLIIWLINYLPQPSISITR